MNTKKKIFWLNVLTLVFIALNLRLPITSVGPMVEDIRQYFGLNAAFVGYLTTLPLIAFGVFSFIVARLHHIKAMIAALICIMLGEILRAYGGFIDLGDFIDTKIISLFLGTIIMGAGIAMANVLLPTFVNTHR